jgi:hypothetical protein
VLCGHQNLPGVLPKSGRLNQRGPSYGLLIVGAWLSSLTWGCQAAGGLRGRIVAADGRQGVPCKVEVNSVASPFFAPDVVEGRTGGSFAWSCKGDETIEAVYTAVRCEGYELGLASQLSVQCSRRMDVGDILVRPAAKGGAELSPSAHARAAQQ